MPILYSCHQSFSSIPRSPKRNMLRKTAKQQRVTLVGELMKCKWCSLAKGSRKLIPTSTGTRAVQPLDEVLMDASGPQSVESVRGARYSFLSRDIFSRIIWMYFRNHKSDITRAFELLFLANVGSNCLPSVVKTMRYDSGGGFAGSLVVSVEQVASGGSSRRQIVHCATI